MNTKQARYLYDNFLEDDVLAPIENQIIYEESFPWFVRSGTVSPNDGRMGFSHCIYDRLGANHQVINAFTPVFEKLKAQHVLRLKANLEVKHSKPKPNEFHTDFSLKGHMFWTCVLYLNDNNGYTIFEDDLAPVKSKRNRAVVFPMHLRHAGCPQTDTDSRYVLNINFISTALPKGCVTF